ncbi:hypothetical protein [Lactobacillus gasseri]|uniref:hypothetical protein n=1 Tax=Lactobacillus gasseri TaxID=1596 RepID=UPI0032EFCFB7
MGKTSLLADITSNLVKKDNWIIVYLAMTNDLLETLIQIIYREAGSKIKKALNTIDEVKETPEIVNLASIYQIMVLKEYPINIMMTGLAKNVSELQNNDVLTFLLRSGRIPLGPLDAFDIQFRYQKAFERANKKISEANLMRMTKLTKGYAYAFQDLGYYVWKHATDHITESDIDDILPLFKNDLYKNAYTKIISELSPTDQKFLMIMAKAIMMLLK